jgi:hypothetical protein
MKNLLLTSVFVAITLTSGANAASVTAINGVQGEQMCKEHIANLVKDSGMKDSELNFQRQAASSFRGSNFKYWINANERVGEQRATVRYRCEISRDGELVEVIEEPGRWNI